MLNVLWFAVPSVILIVEFVFTNTLRANAVARQASADEIEKIEGNYGALIIVVMTAIFIAICNTL